MAEFATFYAKRVNLLIPLKKTKVTKLDKQWMTSAIKMLIIRRQKDLHEYGKNSESYKLWRNKVQESIKPARAKYYARCVEKLKVSNPSKWWKEIKSLGGISSKSCWYNQLLSHDVPSCRELADVFNNFLHFVPLSCENDHLVVDVPNEYLVDEFQVYSDLRKIKVNKSSGPDVIPNKILKVFASVIMDIYNASRSRACFHRYLNVLLLSQFLKSRWLRRLKKI